MFWHYNHHYREWPIEGDRPYVIDSPTIETLQNPNGTIVPWFCVPISEVNRRLTTINKDGEIVWEWKHNWMFAFRDISNPTNERTMIPTITPRYGMNNKAPEYLL